jgi:hypothetical protein
MNGPIGSFSLALELEEYLIMRKLRNLKKQDKENKKKEYEEKW